MLGILEDIKRRERIVMMGRLDTGQDKLFYSFNLDNHVPCEHLLRGIDHFLDLRDLRRLLAPFYSPMGRPSLSRPGSPLRRSTQLDNVVPTLAP
jgi:hypothetical protein